ncbi:MAG: DNA primase [Dongiaceae bacterium]
MMKFPPSFLDEIRERVGLADTISRHVKLVKKGREYSGLCPFHSEKSPSFTVNEEKGFYHCFGCAAHGDVIRFVMTIEHLGFPQAVEKLAQQAGLPMPRMTPEEEKREEERQHKVEINQAAALFFEKNLQSSKGAFAREYLTERGLKQSTIKHFGLGLSFDERDGLKRYLAENKYTEQQALQAGLLINPDEGSAYDRFRSRLMFPIHSSRGEVIAFGGRIMGEGQPKYLNSPETELFHKGRTLYAEHLARKAAAKAGHIIVVEGYMDVIALHQAGLENTVAPLGTALTEDHIKRLWRLAPVIYLCFDGDKAGQQAMARAVERIMPVLEGGKEVRFITLPEAEDPDTLIRRQGVAAFQQLLAAAAPLYEKIFEIETLTRPLNTPEAMADLYARLLRRRQAIVDPTLRNMYAEFLKAKFRAMWPSARKQWKGGVANTKTLEGKGTAHLYPQLERACQAVVVAACHYPVLLERGGEHLGHLHFLNPKLEKLRQALVHLSAQGEEAVVEQLQTLGLLPLLDELRQPALYQLYVFTKPGSDLAQVQERWFQLVFDLKQKLENLAAPPLDLDDMLEEEGWERFVHFIDTHQNQPPALLAS